MADSSSVPESNLIRKISNIGHYIPISKLAVVNPVPHLPALASSMKNGVSSGCTAVTSAASYTYNALPQATSIVQSCGKLAVVNPVPHLPALASSMKNGVSAGCTAVTSAASYTYNALPQVTGVVQSCGKVIVNTEPYLPALKSLMSGGFTTGSIVAYNALCHTYKGLPQVQGMIQSWGVLRTLYSASHLPVTGLMAIKSSIILMDSIARGNVQSWKIEAEYDTKRNEYTFKGRVRV